MGLFGTVDKDNRKVEVPDGIFAHISVLGDHISQEGGVVDDTEKPLQGTSVPSVANPIPHGSAEVFSDGQPVSSPLAESDDKPVSFAVSPEMAESSPFLQTLPPQERMVPQKEKGGIEPPMFLTENSHGSGLGFNQSQSNMFVGGFSPAVGSKSIIFSDTSSPNHPASHKVVWIFAGIFVTLALGLGAAYYFLYVYADQSAAIDPIETALVVATSDTQAGGEKKKSSEFSLGSANYLSLNVETVSGNEIRAQLKKTADRIRKAGIASPVEFLVTDQNNTPIAFSRFILLAGMKVPEEIIDAADEHFSIFVLAEPDRARIGLLVTMKQDAVLPTLFKKTEGDLAIAMQTFFLEENIPPVKKAVFKQGAYRDIPVRYSNVPGAENLSVDYASVNNLWYIGTSKEVVRGMLDHGKK